jgi:DNA-directed RNA polymerase specialized sigma24 family protein
MTPSDTLALALDLVRRAKRGEQQAVDQLLQLYLARVHRIVRLRLKPSQRLRLQSGKALEQRFIAAVRDFTRFELSEEGEFINWLAVLVAEGMIDAGDDDGTATRHADDYVPSEFKIKSGPVGVDLVATGWWPESEVADSGKAELVEECVIRLPIELRELIILRNHAGLSWEMIAKESGSPNADAARVRHAGALVLLGQRLRDGSG